MPKKKILVLPSLDRTGTIPEGLRVLMRAAPTKYRTENARARLLKGLAIGEGSKLTVESAIIFVWTVASVAAWIARASEQHERYQAALKLSARAWKQGKKPSEAVAKARMLHAVNGAKHIEALGALGLALSSDYPGHSLRLWRQFEGAMCSDGLSGPDKSPATEDEFKDHFERIRSRLNTASKPPKNRTIDADARTTWRALCRAPFFGGVMDQRDHPDTWPNP